MMNKYEFRGEVRAVNESRMIEGKAISFETESNDLGFIETLKRGCITEETINSSNIVFTYNHQRDRILARSKNGQGNLELELKDDGVYFRFNAPNTTLGNDVLEDIRCGNLSKCSFCFTMPENEDAQRWYRTNDGVLHRDIYQIDKLWDCAVVVDEAYSSTYISARNAEVAEVEQRLAEEEARKIEESTVVEEPKEADKPEETPVVEEPKEEVTEPVEEPKEEPETVEETVIEEVPETDDKQNDNTRSIEQENDKNINKNSDNIIMNKNFSLVKAVRAAVNGKPVDDAVADLMASAQKEMRASGINYEGQIQLPLEVRDGEVKEAVTVNNVTEDITGEGEHVVELNFQSMLKPMREKSVLFKCGAKVMSGLVGDIKVPELKDGGTFAGWASEIEEADEYFASFDSFTISPKRLTVVTAISKQMLAQDSIGVENALREDIMKKFANKLEATIFGNGAGDADTPAGLLNGLTPVQVKTYADICDLEATPADSYNNFADFIYILSPKAKAALRCMIKENNNTGMVLSGDSVDGTPSQTTTFLGKVNQKDFLYLDPSAIWICQWGGLDITVDNITLAARGMVKLILNMYVNVKYVRGTESIIYGKIVPNTKA